MKAIFTGLAVLLAMYAGTSTFGASAAMQIPRLPVLGSPASVGLAFEDVAFASRVDKVFLKGWFIPTSSNGVLIIVHGGFQNRLDPTIDTLEMTRDVANKGFNLLLFDLRGRGDSAGVGRSLSSIDKDIGGAADYLKGRGSRRARSGLLAIAPARRTR